MRVSLSGAARIREIKMVFIGIRLRRPRTLIVSVFVLAALILYICTSGKGAVKSCYDDPLERIALIRACGYETSDCEASTVTVPEVFSAVYEDYNDLQKKQGFDLSLFKGETVIRYTYTVTNYPSDETVLIHMLVNDGVLIGADVMSTALDGFIKPLLH